jgi:hypothetical protein
VPLFVHCNFWQYIEGGGKSKYCIIENFCSHTFMGEGNNVSGGTILGFDSTLVKEGPQQKIGLPCVDERMK